MLTILLFYPKTASLAILEYLLNEIKEPLALGEFAIYKKKSHLP